MLNFDISFKEFRRILCELLMKRAQQFAPELTDESYKSILAEHFDVNHFWQTESNPILLQFAKEYLNDVAILNDTETNAIYFQIFHELQQRSDIFTANPIKFQLKIKSVALLLQDCSNIISNTNSNLFANELFLHIITYVLLKSTLLSKPFALSSKHSDSHIGSYAYSFQSVLTNMCHFLNSWHLFLPLYQKHTQCVQFNDTLIRELTAWLFALLCSCESSITNSIVDMYEKISGNILTRRVLMINFQYSKRKFLSSLDFSFIPFEMSIINGKKYWRGFQFTALVEVYIPNNTTNVAFAPYSDRFVLQLSTLAHYIDFDLLIKIRDLCAMTFSFPKTLVECNQYYNEWVSGLSVQERQQQHARIVTLQNYLYLLELYEQYQHVRHPLYFTYIVDFRGRTYTYSNIGPTGDLLFRYIYHYGDYSQCELNHLRTQISKTNQVLIEYFTIEHANVFAHKFKVDDSNVFYALAWLCLEFVKPVKSKLLNNGAIQSETLVECGYEFMIKLSNSNFDYRTVYPALDFDDALEMLKNCAIFEQLQFNSATWKKYPIYKDSTASVLQHFPIFLGIKDEKAYEKLNLSGTNAWYDPYSQIINAFRFTLNIDNYGLFDKYCTRQTLKKVIMTKNYSARYRTLWAYFIEECKISQNLHWIPKIEYDELQNLFKKFYQFLQSNVETELFYRNNSKSLITYFKARFDEHLDNPNLSILFSDQSTMQYKYNREIPNQRIDIKLLNNKRVTYKFQRFSNTFDYNKTFDSALLPNLVHGLDSLFARNIHVALGFSIITVHDAFGIEFLRVGQLLDAANETYDKCNFSQNPIKTIKVLRKHSLYILL